jgi:cell division protein FtsA
MTEYIVAIDLGTSHITGIVGEKTSDGLISVVVYDTEDSSSCIRRGNVYNLEETAVHVTNLIKKLECKLNGGHIEKAYVGVGGQSLRTIEHTESKESQESFVVTDKDILNLKEQCEKYTPDLLDVLDIASPVYYLDDRREISPVGIPCKHFEARYKLVVGRPSIRRELINSITERAKIVIEGIVVSPLALADAMLSKEEKELGCALVDFGAGVTKVAVYKNSELIHLSIIPLGGNLITRDIASLQITEAESEKLKVEYGSAILQKEDEEKVLKIDMEGSNREIGINDLNAIIEARIKEIVENVYARINESIDLKSLGSGIVLAGCASNLRKLTEFMMDRFKIKVRFSALRSGLIRSGDEITGNPSYMLVASILLKGKTSCVSFPFKKPEKPTVEELIEEENPFSGKGISGRKKKDRSKKKKKKDEEGSWTDIFKTIFKED